MGAPVRAAVGIAMGILHGLGVWGLKVWAFRLFSILTGFQLVGVWVSGLLKFGVLGL